MKKPLLILSCVLVAVLSCTPDKPKYTSPVDPLGENYQIPGSASVTKPASPVPSGTKYTISWNAVDRAASYRIEESKDSAFKTLTAQTVTETNSSFTHSENAPVVYYYRVRGENGDYIGEWSEVQQVTVYPPPPDALSNIIASVVSSSRVDLSWKSTTTIGLGFRIECKKENNSFIEIGLVDSNINSFSALWLTENTEYTFRVCAYNAGGNSDYSKEITVRTLIIAPWIIANIEYIDIPGADFSMGSNVLSNGRPVHRVTLSSFEMSIYEITQGQYTSIIGTNPSSERFGIGDMYPVYYVSWWNAIKFCNALSKKAGLEQCYDESTGACDFSKYGFRLPTEAEWEYACRAGTETLFYTGNNITGGEFQRSSDLELAGWFWDNTEPYLGPRLVGKKKPNAFGLYDMHGNVWEWCNDWYGLYTSDNQINPIGVPSGSDRVSRGGSWENGAYYCTSFYRNNRTPSYTSKNQGFRIVRRFSP